MHGVYCIFMKKNDLHITKATLVSFMFTTYTAKIYQLCQIDFLQCYSKIYISFSKLIHIFRKIFRKTQWHSNAFDRINQKCTIILEQCNLFFSFPYVRYFENKTALNCCARGVLNHVIMGKKNYVMSANYRLQTAPPGIDPVTQIPASFQWLPKVEKQAICPRPMTS